MLHIFNTSEHLQLAGFLGGYEWILIIVAVLILFGGKKIPELMRGIGKGVREFKDGINPDEQKKKDEGEVEKKE